MLLTNKPTNEQTNPAISITYLAEVKMTANINPNVSMEIYVKMVLESKACSLIMQILRKYSIFLLFAIFYIFEVKVET